MKAPAAPAAFGLLGPLLVTDVHGKAIPIPQAKQRVIMAALLLRANVTVSSDQLADALWQQLSSLPERAGDGDRRQGREYAGRGVRGPRQLRL